MDRSILQIRKGFGRVFATILPEGFIIPWRVLSLQEYFEYHKDIARGVFPIEVFEDEIFRLCVLDEKFIRQMDFLRAGEVTTVVSNIWEASAPADSQQLQHDLEVARMLIRNGSNVILHQLAELVAMAYPYKPEELYSMNYHQLMDLAAKAESKLLRLGVIQEPVSLILNQENQRTERVRERPLDKIDAKRLWDQRHKSKPQIRPPSRTVEQLRQEPGLKLDEVKTDQKWWKVSPILEAQESHNIDFVATRREADLFGARGWDATDRHHLANEMIKDAQVIYKDVLASLAEKNKQ